LTLNFFYWTVRQQINGQTNHLIPTVHKCVGYTLKADIAIVIWM